MSNYLEAYKARLIRNEKEILALVESVIKINPAIDVYYNRNSGHIKSITFIRNEMINKIAFHETPYRWSGCGYSEFRNSHVGLENSAMPFTVKDVLLSFTPITSIKKDKNYFTSVKQYLEWYSFLVSYKLPNKDCTHDVI